MRENVTRYGTLSHHRAEAYLSFLFFSNTISVATLFKKLLS
jgi:hypothetical protein